MDAAKTKCGSYRVEHISENWEIETERLKAQVDLFWEKEKEFYRKAGLGDGMMVVEFGCGPGFMVEKLLNELPFSSIIGVEIDSRLLGYCAKYLAGRKKHKFHLVRSSILDCGLAQNSFDFAIVRLVLEHLPEPQKAVREVYRVLKPGGSAVFIDNDFDFHIMTWPDAPTLQQLYYAYGNARVAEGGNPKIGRELPTILKDGGFINIDLGVIPAHSQLIGDSAFTKSEGLGIPAKLVRDGYLSSKTLGELAVQWRKMITAKNHAIYRQLFICSGQKAKTSTLEPAKTEHQAPVTQKPPVRIARTPGHTSYTDMSTLSFEKHIESVGKEVLKQVLQISNDDENSELPLPVDNSLDASFLELGLNSTRSVEFVDMLNSQLDIKLGVEAVFDFQNLKELTAHIIRTYPEQCGRHLSGPKARQETEKQPSTLNSPAAGKNETHRKCRQSLLCNTCYKAADIAVIGMSGRLPGAAGVDQYWANLKSARCSIAEICRKGWDLSQFYDLDSTAVNRSISKWGGLLDGIDEFDPLFFRISPSEAELMDPQQRLMLEEGFKTFEDAGYPLEQLSGQKIGVFIGARTSDYLRVASSKAHYNAHMFLGNDISILAARIAYHCNLKGPCITVDTACSSSLVAVHLACESIRRGESDMALAGGVFLMPTPEFYILASKTNMLSPDGKCKTFDNGANGIVPGEAVGAVLIKPLTTALKDRDIIYGIIKGTAINQDGRTKGITAPSTRSQCRVIEQAMQNAGITAKHLAYVEAHGTGTKLGDPIEFRALSEVFSRVPVEKQSCIIGSHKPNIGHTIVAAGIAGLFKILLSFQHQLIPPTIGLSRINQHIELGNSPFRINTEPVEWKTQKDIPLTAGISSFGFSGTNCHMILEAPPNRGVSNIDRNACGFLIPLSAKTPEACLDKARNLKKWLENKDSNLLIDDIAYTLQTGRSHFRCRRAMVVGDLNQLHRKLAAVIDEDMPWDNSCDATKDCYSHQDVSLSLLAEQLAQNVARQDGQSQSDSAPDLNRLADLYVKGIPIPWRALYQELHRPQRISLPPYPFQRQRYWAGNSHHVKGAGPQLETVERLHPLIDRNVSTLEVCQYTKVIRPESHFFTHHRVMGADILPGAVGIEMARAAGELAMNRKIVCIKDLIWQRPINHQEGSLQIRVKPAEGKDAAAFEVLSGTGGESEGDSIGIRGSLHFESANTDRIEARAPMDIQAIMTHCPKTMSRADCYNHFKTLGFDYGPTFTTIEQFHTNGVEAIARLRFPESLKRDFAWYKLHPALLDGAFQTVLCLHTEMDSSAHAHVPFSLSEMVLIHPLAEICYVHVLVASSQQQAGNKAARFHLRIADEMGNISADILDFCVRPLKKAAAERTSDHVTTAVPVHFYRPVWSTAPLPGLSANFRPAAPVGGVVLVLATDSSTLRDSIKEQFRQDAKHPVVLATAGTRFKALGPCDYVIDPDNPDHFESLLAALAQHALLPQVVIHALPADSIIESSALTSRPSAPIYSLLYLCQALGRRRPQNRTVLLHAFIATKDHQDAWHWAVGGFARTLRLENPHLVLKTVGISSVCLEEPLGFDKFSRILLSEATAADEASQPEIYYRGIERQIRTYAEYVPEERAALSSVLRPSAVYLITGGTGKLGTVLAEYLAVEIGAKPVLVSRSLPSDPQVAGVLERLGTAVVHMRADVSDKEQVREIAAMIRSKLGAIHGVFHCAGLLHDGLIYHKPARDVEHVLGPKILGALNLDRVTQNDPLDLFVLFSSVSAVMGNPGQCDYAYANSFMDAFALHREKLRQSAQRRGITLAINWSLWQAGGMQVDEATAKMICKRTGMEAMDTRTGLAAFQAALHSGLPQLIVAVGQKEKLVQALNPVPLAATQPIKSASESRQQDEGTLLQRRVENELMHICAELLKVDKRDLDPDAELADYGVDSIALMNLLNRIEAFCGKTIAPNAVIEHQTIADLGCYLIENGLVDSEDLHPPEKPSPQASEAGNPATDRDPPVPESVFTGRHAQMYTNGETRVRMTAGSPNDPIAVIAVACRFPGADTPEDFHENLIHAKNLVSEPPADRQRLLRAYASEPQGRYDETYSVWGGYIKDIGGFDPGYFNISEREALLMDPQHRILLELTHHLLDHAGYLKKEMDGTPTGVFIGGGESNYIKNHMHRIARQDLKYMLVNSLQSMMAGRISNTYNLTGPSQTLDTACSSALVAVHLACASLRERECDAAVAGGIELLFDPFLHLGFGHTGVLSDDGKAYVFDQKAKGIVLGEGAGLVLLKRLDAALADGDQILAVICGSAVNNDGRTMGVTVPSMERQKAVIKRALSISGIGVEQIGYLEAHGTGTLLGDPIEIKAATEVYRQYTSKTGFCAVGSVKSNIGHLLRAAGIAGLIKLILAMRHKEIPPTIHCSTPHPRFGFDRSPFFPANRRTAWTTNGTPRAAAISSFGFSGTNCHMILKESPLDGTHDVRCKRKPLSPTLFQHKHYWLGDDLAPVGEDKGRFDRQFYSALLKDLENGAISAAHGMELVRQRGLAPESSSSSASGLN